MEPRMRTPQCHIAFAPFGVGILCALTCYERGSDVYGWWIGARDTEYWSAFFALEGFYTPRDTRFLATRGSDLYGGWRYEYSARAPQLEEALPVDDEVAHELERVQDAFASEWLFFDGDERCALERVEYDRANFPLRAVNLRPSRLRHFDQSQPVWLHQSGDFDPGVLGYLQRYWPLDY
jgi:hypothetical protein